MYVRQGMSNKKGQYHIQTAEILCDCATHTYLALAPSRSLALGTCPLDFHLFNFSGHFRATQIQTLDSMWFPYPERIIMLACSFLTVVVYFWLFAALASCGSPTAGSEQGPKHCTIKSLNIVKLPYKPNHTHISRKCTSTYVTLPRQLHQSD